jgi:hypothetical protein
MVCSSKTLLQSRAWPLQHATQHELMQRHAQHAREQPRVVGHRPPVIVTGKTRRAIIARTSIFGHNASSFSVSDAKKKHQQTAHTY